MFSEIPLFLKDAGLITRLRATRSQSEGKVAGARDDENVSGNEIKRVGELGKTMCATMSACVKARFPQSFFYEIIEK